MANLPRRFGSYLLLQRLARGGMGEIYLGQKARGHGTRYVALKTLRQDLTRDKEYVQRFLDEARVAIILNHPAINKVFDVGFAEDTFFLELEYISGRDVRALLDRARDLEHRVPPAVAYYITDQLLDALAYLHDAKDLTGARLNLIHRDVSPQNVMTSWKGEVTLIDFGLARFAARSTATEPGMVMGKLRYMAPEQACGYDIDQRVDVFASGVVLYELLSGRRLYENVDPAQLWQVVAAGRALDGVQWDSVPPDAAPLIRRSLAIKREERYPTAKAFLTDLRRISGEIKNRQCEPLARLLADLYEVDLKLEHEFIDKLGRLAPFELTGDEVTHSVSLADPAAAVPEEPPANSAFDAAPTEAAEPTTAPGSPRPTAPAAGRAAAPAPVELRPRPGAPADISAGYGYLEEMLEPQVRGTARPPAERTNGFTEAPSSGEWAGPTDASNEPRAGAKQQLPPLKPTEATVAVEMTMTGPTLALVPPSAAASAVTAPHSLQDEQTMLLGQAKQGLAPGRAPSRPPRDARPEPIDSDLEAEPPRRGIMPWLLLAAAALGALAIVGAIWLRPGPEVTVADASPVAVAATDAAIHAAAATDAAPAMIAPVVRPTPDAGDGQQRTPVKKDRWRKGDKRPPLPVGRQPEPPPVTPPPVKPPEPPLEKPPEKPPVVARVDPPVENRNFGDEAREMLKGRALSYADGVALWPELKRLRDESTGGDEKARVLALLQRNLEDFELTRRFIDAKVSRVQKSYGMVRPRLNQQSSMFRDLEAKQQKMLAAYAKVSDDAASLASVNRLINELELSIHLASR